MDINEINSEIYRLENADTTYSNCEKLSTLYTVRGGLDKQVRCEEPRYSFASAPASEFVQTVMEYPYEEVITVLDEHMEAIKVMFPREYRSVLRKIQALKK